MDASFVDLARFAVSTPRPPSRDHFGMLDVGKASLRTFDRGSGPRSFVFTPDPPNVLEHHLDSLLSFSQRGRALGIELPGFGHSRPSGSFAFSVDENADVLLEALEKLNVEGAVLMFPCLAGLVALEVARRSPGRVAAVVLVQTPSFRDGLTWAERVDFRGVVGTPILGQLFVRTLRRPLARSWYQAALPRGANTGPYVEQALHAYSEGADYCLASALQAYCRSAEPRDPVPVPVLSVWGNADRTHRSSDPSAGLELAPRGKLVVFDGIGHFPDLEQPERFEQEVARFLDDEVR